MFTAHLAGQRVLILLCLRCGGLRGGGCWCRTIQRTLIIVVPAVTRGRSWVRAEGLLVVSVCLSHFVSDEAVTCQGGGGREAGATLQTLQATALCPPSPVLADVLEEQCLVLSGEAAGGTAKSRIGRRVCVRCRGGGP